MSVPKGSRKIRVYRYREGSFYRDRLPVVRERPITLYLNGEEIVTLLCIDTDPQYLAVGFLASEGLLGEVKGIRSIEVDREEGAVRIHTSAPLPKRPAAAALKPTISTGCGKGTTFRGLSDSFPEVPDTGLEIHADGVFRLMHKLTDLSTLYKATRGTHNCGLSDGREILVFHADVGRHNAVDKIYGQCLLEEIPLYDKILVTTGRITSEILMKIGRMGLPVLISRHAATDLAVEIGRKHGKTLVGHVRGGRFTVYSGFHRIKR